MSIKKIKQLINRAGCEYVGIWHVKKYGIDDIIHFNDPTTGTTLAMRQKQITYQSLVKHIEESRVKFGI